MNSIETFKNSLGEKNVSWTQIPPEEFESALEDVVDRPAVGARLSEVGVEQPEWVTLDPSSEELEAAHTGVTAASFGIADYGSIVLPSTSDGSEQVSLFPDRHVAVLSTDEVVPDMGDAFARLGATIRADRGSAIIATGPSATADMGSLVYGAHGPKTVHVILVTNRDTAERTAGAKA